MTVVDRTANEQIVSNAVEQIAHIQHQVDELSQQAQGYEAELDRIGQAKNSRLTEIQTAQADVASKQEAHDQAVTYAKVAHDTPNESVAVKNVSSAKKELSTVLKRLEQLEAKDTEAKAVEQTRKDELLDALNKAHAEMTRQAQELHSIEGVRKQESRHLAELRRATILLADIEQKQHIDELKAQLVEAETKRLDLHESAVQELEGHPDLQQSIARLRPLDNPTTRLFEATLHYLDAFMDNAREVEHGAKLASLRNAANMSYTDLWQYLIIHPGEFNNFLQRRPEWNPPPTLPATHNRLKQLLQEYRSSLQEPRN